MLKQVKGFCVSKINKIKQKITYCGVSLLLHIFITSIEVVLKLSINKVYTKTLQRSTSRVRQM